MQAKRSMIFALSLSVMLLMGLGIGLTISTARQVAFEGLGHVLTNKEHGYSLYYPIGYNVQYPNENETVISVGSLLNVEQPRVYIEVREATGHTAAQVADELMTEFTVGFDVKRTSVMIDGEEAVVLDNVPGQDINRLVIVVHDDRLYKLTFVPMGEEYGKVYALMEDLYATIINSFRFLSRPVGFDEHPARKDETVVSQGGPPEIQLENEELVGNPFETLLGPIQAPNDWSVRPCSGETPLLCVYQGRTLLGSVELTTFPLARHLDFEKMLSDAGIPLGSVEYTDPENAPQVRTALAAHAAAYLGDLAQDRSVTYPEGHTFTPVALEWVHVGSLPGVAYGFTSVDQGERTFERRLTYAAFDNDTLYLFSTFYATGMPEGFSSDQDLLHFEPYLRRTLANLRLPAGEDWRSPGAELLPSGPRLVVQRPDGSIQYVTLEGTTAVLVADAPLSLLPAGYGGVLFGGTPMTDGPMVYVRQWSGGLYVLDTILGRLFSLDFVPSVASPVAARPLTEGLLPEGAPISLAWSEFSDSHTATARLYLSAPDGSQKVEVLEETCSVSAPLVQLVPWRWRQDYQLYLMKQPMDGQGGFPPFVGAANLWAFDPQTGSSVELVSNEVTSGKLCLDAISPDDRLVVHHCDEGQIALLDLETGKTTAVGLPDQVISAAHLGSVRFSPDGSRIAFAMMTGGIGLAEETRGDVAVSEGLGGDSRVIATSEPGEWFSVVAWLYDDLLVLQSYHAGPDGWPAVWLVGTDGSGLVKLVDGVFLAKFDG